MSERIFPEELIEVAGTRTMAMKISCVCCGAAAYYPSQTGIHRKPPIAAAQHFRNKGWLVGNSPRKDFCPVHANPAKRNRRIDMAEAEQAAEKPREMSREERRIINDKLDEVYGTGGYKTPWTDSAVAKDLGVPRDWVAKVRDAFFGPAGSNPLFDDYLAQKDLIERTYNGVVVAFESVAKAVAAYEKEHAGLKKMLDDLRRIGSRIEREIGK